MKRFLAATSGLVFLGLLVYCAGFTQPTLTGDRTLDSLLGEINLQEKVDPEGYILQLSRSHNVPEEEIWRAKNQYGLSAGDTYMATVLSRIFNKSVGDVAEEYKKNQGQGWGVMAMNRGIKPGSPEFHRMKANARSSVDHMKSTAKAKKNRQKQEKDKDRKKRPL